MILILLCSFLSFLCAAETEVDSLENYPLIKDARNYKKSTGGKSIDAQGILLTTKTEKKLFGENNFNSLNDYDTKYPWRYMVTTNCKKGSPESLVKLVTKLTTKLLPVSHKFRLAILIGINERMGSNTDIDVPFDWGPFEVHRTDFEALEIPILFIYTPWTAYRDAPEEMIPEDIIRNIKQLSDQLIQQSKNPKLTDRQKENILKKVEKIDTEDRTHGYPFGKMRTHLLSNQYTKDFVNKFSNKSPVFFHIQDADFTNLQTYPLCYDFGAPTELPLIKDTNYLLRKYDYLIAAMHNRNNCFPAIVGGAHVYDPEEELGNISKHAKKWTRFASEMGNLIKHILASFQPYGLYFHEPNTMCLAPQTIKYLYYEKEKTIPAFLKRLQDNGIEFGMDSEIQDFTRTLFHGLNDDLCRMGMIFSPQLTLATSMKRSGRPFNIRFSGTFDSSSKKFNDWERDDIVAIHGMPQEIIDPNGWMCNVTTSFAQHRSSDSRTILCNLFSIFDPHALTGIQYAPSGFYEILVKYKKIIDEQKTEIKSIFQNLLTAYDKLGQGNLAAFYILSAAWEAGQAMRIMFLDHLEAPKMPANKKLILPLLVEERKVLADRINYKLDNKSPFSNPHIISLLDLDKIPKNICISDMLLYLINITYKHTGTYKETGEIIGMSASTISKIIKDQSVSPTARNKYKSRLGVDDLNKEFSDLPKPVRLKYIENFK